MKSQTDKHIVQNFSTEECKEFINASLTNNGWGVIDDYVAVKNAWNFNLDEIKNPVHIFHGGSDTLSPITQAHYLNSQIKNSQLHIIEGQGHFLLHKNLDQFLESLNLLK